MANVTRFDPFAELTRFDPLGEDFFRGLAWRPVLRQFESEPQMRLDVHEDEETYSVKAEIPGVQKEDIKVAVDGNRISISAEVKKEKEEKEGKKTIRSERYYGSVSRGFTLAHEIDEARAQAKYTDGVLELKLPKKSGSRSKHLTVS